MNSPRNTEVHRHYERSARLPAAPLLALALMAAVCRAIDRHWDSLPVALNRPDFLHEHAPMKYPSQRPYRDPRQNDIEFLRDLKKANADLATYVSAEAADRPGFELPRLAKEHVLREAELNMVQPSTPPRAPEDQAVLLGHDPDTGVPVELNVADMGHAIILGPTKSGENNTAYQMGKGLLQRERRFEVIGQKGDELNAVNLWSNSIYLPVQRDPWNDWTPIGPDRVGFWTAAAEAFAIPKAIAPQTQPEFALLLQQMWASAPDVAWCDLRSAFRWNPTNPAAGTSIRPRMA